MSWKLTATTTRSAIETALQRREETVGFDDAIVLTGFEIDPDHPMIWCLDAYTEPEPGEAELQAVRALFDDPAPELQVEELPETDWVTESQRGAQPIRAGRFHVHTPDHTPDAEQGVVNFCIPAAQAFGTGHHETTAGCLEMLDAMHDEGLTHSNFADIGTGTGLLAFGVMALWPNALATASDIDPVCLPAVLGNCELNNVAIGEKRGALSMLIADGMDDPALKARAPYDLLIANILAAPLIDMASDFAKAVVPNGSILLAGLLERQEDAVRDAYRESGFHLHHRIVNGDWSILWLKNPPQD